MNRTILLADDSLTIQKVVELTFADTQYSVVALSSGEDLLQQLPSVHPDVIICDIIMPGKDGYEVCQQIKSDPDTLHIPVVLLSGTFEPFDRDRALAAGCSEIITKPFEARKLVETVDRLLSAPPEEVPIETAMEDEVPAAETLYTPSPASEQPAVAPPPAHEAQPPTAGEGAEESGLDFTDTGFAEMEAAGEDRSEPPMGLPDDGLDFEFNEAGEAFGDEGAAPEAHDVDERPDRETEEELIADETEEVAAASLPPEPVATAADQVEATTGPDIDLGEEVAPPAPAPKDEPFPETEPRDEGAQRERFDRADPFLADTDTPYNPLEGGPFEAEDEPPQPEQSPSPLETEGPATSPPPPPGALAPPSDDWGGVPEDTAPEEQEEQAQHEEVEGAAADRPRDGADTAPLAPPPGVEPAAKSATAARPVQPLDEAATSSAALPSLSDEDIDRVARRLLELASDQIASVAWEVIPDMAEIVVRERIRQLEAEAERASPDGVQ